jgi:hypothetical protein
MSRKDKVVTGLTLAFAANWLSAMVLTNGRSACAILYFGFYFMSLRRVNRQPQNPRFWLAVNMFLAAVVGFSYFCSYVAKYPHSGLGHVLDLIGLLLFVTTARVLASNSPPVLGR